MCVIHNVRGFIFREGKEQSINEMYMYALPGNVLNLDPLNKVCMLK